jgi:hypothetical protein
MPTYGCIKSYIEDVILHLACAEAVFGTKPCVKAVFLGRALRRGCFYVQALLHCIQGVTGRNKAAILDPVFCEGC